MIKEIWFKDHLRAKRDIMCECRRPKEPGDHCIYHRGEWCTMCGLCIQNFKTPDHKCKLELKEYTGGKCGQSATI